MITQRSDHFVYHKVPEILMLCQLNYYPAAQTLAQLITGCFSLLVYDLVYDLVYSLSPEKVIDFLF
jgi:hypothetical protein